MAKNPKTHTTSCKWEFAADGAGATGTQANIKDSFELPDNAIVTGIVMYVRTAPGGASGGIKLSLEDGTNSIEITTYSSTHIGTAENVITGTLKAGKCKGLSKLAISPVGSVFSTGGDLRFIVTYVLGA
jgi:hypothetical protein